MKEGQRRLQRVGADASQEGRAEVKKSNKGKIATRDGGRCQRGPRGRGLRAKPNQKGGPGAEIRVMSQSSGISLVS